jgi:hypothetical protein
MGSKRGTWRSKARHLLSVQPNGDLHGAISRHLKRALDELGTADRQLAMERADVAKLERQLAEARARYHTDVDGAISARLAAEDAFREQEQYARDRFALFDISHKDTVHGLLDIARRALVTTKEPTDD